MFSHSFTSSLAAAALVLGAWGAPSSAQAHSDVFLSIGVQVPGLYVQSVPVYVQPPRYYTPAPIYYPQHFLRNDPRSFSGYVPRNERGHSAQARQWPSRWLYGDLDRDGIVNRYDRDRDGDGVRNRFDRQPNNPWRR